MHLLGKKRVCFRCVGEGFLNDEIRRTGDQEECSYCGRNAPTLALSEFLTLVQPGLAEFYRSTKQERCLRTLSRLVAMAYGEVDRRESVIDVLSREIKVDEEIAGDIRSVLAEENELLYGGEARLEPVQLGVGAWGTAWPKFLNLIRSKSRYSFAALRMLEELFEGAEDLRTKEGRPIFIEAGPRADLKAVYRARVFRSSGELDSALQSPERTLGPPPEHLASHGRMNATGISVFYGATDCQTAVAEVRPPVGSVVAVARFDFLRTVRLLDLNALDALRRPHGIFRPTSVDEAKRANFLSTLRGHLTDAVLPGDEALDYLPTQMMADFLGNEMEDVDGVTFPSVQSGCDTHNVTLFNKASKVEPRISDVTAQRGIDPYLGDSPERDDREPVLRIDREAIKSLLVRGVDVKVEEFDLKG